MTPFVWQVIGVCAVTFLGVFLVCLILFWLYNRREKRRKHALSLSKLMTRWGLEWFAEVYEMYAVGDYSGLGYKIKETIEAVRTDEVMVQKFDQVFWKVLEYYKDQPEKLTKIKDAIAKKETVTTPTAQGKAA